MADLNFPTSPAVGDTHTVGGKTWIFRGDAIWELNPLVNDPLEITIGTDHSNDDTETVATSITIEGITHVINRSGDFEPINWDSSTDLDLVVRYGDRTIYRGATYEWVGAAEGSFGVATATLRTNGGMEHPANAQPLGWIRLAGDWNLTAKANLFLGRRDPANDMDDVSVGGFTNVRRQTYTSDGVAWYWFPGIREVQPTVFTDTGVELGMWSDNEDFTVSNAVTLNLIG